MEKKNIFLFASIFGLLCLFLIIFFYFNIYLVIFMIALIAVFGVIYLIMNKTVSEDDLDNDDLYDEEDILEEKVQERDEDFSLENFYIYVREIVELIAKSFSKNNLTFLNGFIGNNLLNEFKNTMIEYNNSGYFRMITGIKIRDCKLSDYYINSGYEYLEVKLTYSKIDCSVQNGVVVNGKDDNGNFLDYKYVFCRKLGEYTPNSVVSCPCCGNSASNFSNGKCLNCGNICINEDGFYLIKIDEL